MNRLLSSSVLLPVGLSLLLASSCKGTQDEIETAEPPSFYFDAEPVESYENEGAPDAEPRAEAPTPEEAQGTPEGSSEAPEEPTPADQGDESESAPASDSEQPPAETAPEQPAPMADSPAPPPPPAPAASETKTTPQGGGISSSSLRLEAELTKDAESSDWGVNPYMRSKEKDQPRVRDNYVFLLAGTRQLSSTDWEPVESPGTGGINYLGRGPGGWFHWDMAFSYGADSGNVSDGTTTTSVESTIWELDFGITKMFALGSVVRPYLGVGGTYMRAGGQVITPGGPIDDSGNSFGGYGRAGLAFEITEWGGLIGIDARYVGGTSVSFGPYDTNADGFVGSVTFGFSW